jgi:hypothetical protein
MVQGNILSAELVSFILEEEQIDTIVHFAAQTHVGTVPLPLPRPFVRALAPYPSPTADNSFGNSFQFTETNVLGTHVLLEAAKVPSAHERPPSPNGPAPGVLALTGRFLPPASWPASSGLSTCPPTRSRGKTRHSPLTTHHPPLPTPHSPLTTHHSPLTLVVSVRVLLSGLRRGLTLHLVWPAANRRRQHLGAHQPLRGEQSWC